MSSMLLPLSVVIAAPAPLRSEAIVSSPTEANATVPHASESPNDEVQGTVGRRPSGAEVGGGKQAAQGPMPEVVSAAGNPAPMPHGALSPEAVGRRILSTAFVRVDAHGYLTVERHDGRVVVLRDVVMRPLDYCGVEVVGGTPRRRYCGRYVDVAAARPGKNEAVEPVSAGSDPVRPPRMTSGRK